MAKKVRIKDIAKMAGVSVGTIDRVIHGRGHVAEDVAKIVNQVLKEVNYKPNLHVSSISMHKTYRIIVVIPKHEEGEYWWQIKDGIQLAIDKYDNIDIDCDFRYYNQFDLSSCKSVYEEVVESKPNALIIGPTFIDETIELCAELDKTKTPYVFVDSLIRDTAPIASFTVDQIACGKLISKIMHEILPHNSEIALFQAERAGKLSSNNSLLRQEGFFSNSNEQNTIIYRKFYSPDSFDRNTELIGGFFEDHPLVKGAVILSSRGNIISDYLKRKKLNGIKIVCLDLTDHNKEALLNNEISYILCQKPTLQGFMAVNALITFMCFGKVNQNKQLMPIDILTKENVDFYKEFFDTDS